MSREEAVARIKDHIEIHRYHERNAVKIFEALDMAIKALEQPEQRWIPVSERLPKVAHSVLFSRRSMATREGCLQADGKWWQYRWNEILNADQVTAWKPLPEPYKEEDDDESRSD